VTGSHQSTSNALHRNAVAGLVVRANWRHRHALVLAGTILYLPVIAACTAVTGHPLELVSTYLMVVLLLGLVSASPMIDPAVRQTLATGALLTANVAAIETSGKSLMAHLGFAFVLVLVSVYQSWPLQLFAVSYVAFYYLLLGGVAPDLIFSGPWLEDAPGSWGIVISAACTLACLPAVVSWWINDSASKDAEALRLALTEAAVRERQAAELNDTVMQDLVTALYANESGNQETAIAATRRAVESARHIVDSLLAGTGVPGSLTREHHAQPKEAPHG